MAAVHCGARRYIASFDVGTVNLALVVYDRVAHRIVRAEIINLARDAGDAGVVPYSDRTAEFLVRRAVEKRRAVFDMCCAVAIEKQLMRTMIVVQFLLEAILAPIVPHVVQVPAQNVKRHFRTGTGDHARNKKAATKYFRNKIGPAGCAVLDERFPRKQDDIADAALQAMYVSEKYASIVSAWRTMRTPATRAAQAKAEAAKKKKKKAKASRKRKRARGA